MAFILVLSLPKPTITIDSPHAERQTALFGSDLSVIVNHKMQWMTPVRGVVG